MKYYWKVVTKYNPHGAYIASGRHGRCAKHRLVRRRKLKNQHTCEHSRNRLQKIAYERHCRRFYAKNAQHVCRACVAAAVISYIIMISGFADDYCRLNIPYKIAAYKRQNASRNYHVALHRCFNNKPICFYSPSFSLPLGTFSRSVFFSRFRTIMRMGVLSNPNDFLK